MQGYERSSDTERDPDTITTTSCISMMHMLIVMVMIVTRFFSLSDRLWFKRSKSGSIRILFR
jgi:hypothetical protein